MFFDLKNRPQKKTHFLKIDEKHPQSGQNGFSEGPPPKNDQKQAQKDPFFDPRFSKIPYMFCIFDPPKKGGRVLGRFWVVFGVFLA